MSKQDPWAPFVPTPEAPWDLDKVAHLHRRAGFGATRAELLRDVKDGPKASVDRLLSSSAADADPEQVVASLKRGVLDSGDGERLKAWWLYQILYGADPLREKLTLFWHSHFATSDRKVQSVPLMLEQNETLRCHALGAFADLLNAMIADPAMLVWLDGATSRKEKPNENFGREFLELFTLGVGHYTEKDIREAARAFAGWVREGRDFRRGDVFRLDPAQVDDGEKTFLNQTGRWKPADIVRITLEQPACADFLCRKLYRFLVSEAKQPPERIGPLAKELRKSKYAIRHVVSVILRSHHFYAKENRRQRVAGPVECSAGLLRVLEMPRADVRLLALAAACARQGQDLFHPPSVKGWDGGRTWLNSATVLERGNWANDLVWGNEDQGIRSYDPLAWAKRHGIAPSKTAAALLGLLLQQDVDAKDRDLILRTGRDGSPAALRKALQLILHCPEYQLA
ncbi:MAG: DUF1800 domain-containing protein [Planctomycetes bacterium]|nr:DUF1800 domain-containing protein [Planctomycetota bacterium]